MIGYNWVRDDLSFRVGGSARVVLRHSRLFSDDHPTEYSEFGKSYCKFVNIFVE